MFGTPANGVLLTTSASRTPPHPAWRMVSLLIALLVFLIQPVHPLGTPGGGARPVNVVVERTLPVSPTSGREAWLKYNWEKGCGLPVFVIRKPDGGGGRKRREVAPLFFEEMLSPLEGGKKDDKADEVVQYQVTKLGLLQSELESGSHAGTVTFSPHDDEPQSCTMRWCVSFNALKRQQLWQSITERTIGDAADNLAAYVAVPRLYTRRTRLIGTDRLEAMDAWLSFIFDEGGGLPSPPPIPLGRAGVDERIRMILPPFLIERVVSVDREKGEIWYTVDNPGLLTFYPAHTHMGRVSFSDETTTGGEVEMLWEVEVRPYYRLGWFIRWFSGMIISTLARNLKSHLSEPRAMVKLAPPRGAGSSFGQIRKDSWLGGVLAAHLEDRRSTVEQSVALLQPWTWGRSTDEESEGEEWGTGKLS